MILKSYPSRRETGTLKSIRPKTIHAVILAVPQRVRDFKPRQRVIFLSDHARRALALSAAKSRIRLGRLAKDTNGVPVPFDGISWSLTHKSGYVGAVVAPGAMGIDIEKIRPCARGLFEKCADKGEWALAGEEKKSFKTFFRYWTAKESVLKAAGTGLKDLARCRVIRIIDADHLQIAYGRRDWLIEHRFFDGHIASIVKDDFQIQWTVIRDP